MVTDARHSIVADPVSSSCEVVIVGGGPAGLNAALVLGNACRNVVVLDSGHPRNSASHKLRNYLGRDGVRPADLRNDGRGEILQYGIEWVADTVQSILPVKQHTRRFKTAFHVATKAGRRIHARKVLLATGVEDRLPPLEGLQECYGISAHTCPYCGAWDYRNQHLLAFAEHCDKLEGLVQGLAGWSNRITGLTNGGVLSRRALRRFQLCNVALATEKIIRFVHNEGKLSGVELTGRGFLPANALFLAVAQRPRSVLARQVGCRLKPDGSVHKTPKHKSSVPGVFLAGDVDGDTQFAIVAAADGAIAATNLNRELQKEDAKANLGQGNRQ